MGRKSNLPHDTPVETPAVGAIIEAADLGPDAEVLGAQALSVARGVETLEAAYTAWRELIDAHVRARQRWADERKRLEEQGALLLGAIRAASPVAGSVDALAKTTSLEAFVLDAKKKLEDAQQSLESRAKEADRAFDVELARLRAELVARVTRQAAKLRPLFKLAVRTLGEDRRVLHAHRLGEDESVVALFALTGRIPSRYGFLSDDSTEDLSAVPPVLYADEGVTDVRPKASLVGSLLESRAEVWPVKGSLPTQLPGGAWMRWVARGVVLEAEVQDGEVFRNQLTRDEAERITGLLLANKLAGKLELELVRD